MAERGGYMDRDYREQRNGKPLRILLWNSFLNSPMMILKGIKWEIRFGMRVLRQ